MEPSGNCTVEACRRRVFGKLAVVAQTRAEAAAALSSRKRHWAPNIEALLAWHRPVLAGYSHSSDSRAAAAAADNSSPCCHTGCIGAVVAAAGQMIVDS